MAIIQRNSDGFEILIQTLLNKERLEQQERDLKLREREGKLEDAQRQNVLQGFLQGLQSGGAFATQFSQQGAPPALQGALEDRQLSAEELQNPQVLAAAGDIVAARQTFMQRQATEEAMGDLMKVAGSIKDPNLVRRTRIALNLSSAGMDSSVIRPLVEDIPGVADLVSLQGERVKLRGLEDQREADVSATAWLQREGIVPEGVPLIPGAAQTLLNISEARADDAIDWMQEGIDFITGRIGDSVSGSPFTVSPDGTLQVGGGGEAVTVDQAITEWKSFVERFAPEGVKERVLGQLESGMFERRLRVGRAEITATEIIAAAGDSPETVADIREILSDEFTTSEITKILATARARARRPQR